MNTQQAYNVWADQYDTNQNRTRDLEGVALRASLESIDFETCLEIGCGTGKNTAWFVTKAQQVTAVDLSAAMLAQAKAKINSERVTFYEADILQDWTFATPQYDLIGFSLVLEHIEDLVPIFKKAAAVLRPGGYIYVGELHPFKQYSGSKARFDTETGRHIVDCFNHNITDFTWAAEQSGLRLAAINEYFDDDDRSTIPRILTLLFH